MESHAPAFRWWLRVSGITKTPPPCELCLLPLFRPWLWFTIRRDGNLADRRDGHGDNGTRISSTYSAGPSAAPAAAAGAAAGAAGAAAPPSAASAAAADRGPGGAWSTGDDWFAMQCAHRNLCPVPSRSYSSPGRIRRRNTDIEEYEIRYQSTKLRYSIQTSKKHLSMSTNLRYQDITISKFWSSISIFLRYRTASLSKFQQLSGFDIQVSSISYWFDITGYNLRYIEGLNIRYRVVISYPISKVIFRPSISKVAPLIS